MMHTGLRSSELMARNIVFAVVVLHGRHGYECFSSTICVSAGKCRRSSDIVPLHELILQLLWSIFGMSDHERL